MIPFWCSQVFRHKHVKTMGIDMKATTPHSQQVCVMCHLESDYGDYTSILLMSRLGTESLHIHLQHLVDVFIQNLLQKCFVNSVKKKSSRSFNQLVGDLVFSMFALHLQGWRFDSPQTMHALGIPVFSPV